MWCVVVKMAGKSGSGECWSCDDHAATLCSLATWTDQQVALRHVTSQLSLPTLGHVVSGRYRGIAPADSKHHHHHHHHHHHSSSRRSSSIVFIHSVRNSQKVRRLLHARHTLTNCSLYIITTRKLSSTEDRGLTDRVLNKDSITLTLILTSDLDLQCHESYDHDPYMQKVKVKGRSVQKFLEWKRTEAIALYLPC